MAEFSVLESTTRKFFCDSGGGVICCTGSVLGQVLIRKMGDWLSYTNACEQHARHRVLHISAIDGIVLLDVPLTSSPITARNCLSL